MRSTLALAASIASAPAEIALTNWKESGVSDWRLGFRPHHVVLDITHAADGTAQSSKGTLEIGRGDSARKFTIVSTCKNGEPESLTIDTEGDGKLDNNQPVPWTRSETELPSGEKSVTWHASGLVEVPFPGGPRRGQLMFYRGTPPKGNAPKEPLTYYSDYALTGTATLPDGRKVPAALLDMPCLGQFIAKPESIGEAAGLWLDLDSNGKGGRGEVVSSFRPFQLGDQWFAISNLTPDGKFSLTPAEAPKAEKPTGPDLSPGRTAPAFTATLTNGKSVSFPGDYKGKIVLLDFWATWCGPCLAEVPNVVSAYHRFHKDGLEILGISFDKEGDEAKIAKVTAAKNMSWPQAFDGKGWKTAPGTLYGIRAIPHMMLVDGDTGTILANKNIRGEDLAPAIEKALKDKAATKP